ncbi:hypothetical protein DL95DRAFT_477768 [Leptodontidium sp. 2 PMI_412]|nr:hypothetical protein DL95DRAFT_477768 [Leptodontidium sp. 2 PMI_412]
MDRTSLHHDFGGFRDDPGSKVTSLAFEGNSGPYNHQYTLEDIRQNHEDLTSNPNTPSMTRASSRSTSSFVALCEVCGHYGSQCGCQSQSDTESVRFNSSDVDYSTSPIISSAGLVPRKKEKIRLQRPNLRDLVENSALNPGPRGLGVGLSPPLTICRDLTPSENGSFMERTRSLLFNVTTEADLVQNSDVAIHESPEVENSDSELSDDPDEDDDSDDSANEDNDWSGQDDSLEAIVLGVLGGDLDFAACLIPFLHKTCYLNLNANVRQKVAPWCNNLTKCTPGGEDTSTGQTPSSTAQSNEATGGSRKRQRRYGSSSQNRKANDEAEEEEEDDDEENNDSKGMGDPSSANNTRQVPRLACPFHKFNPSKYCIQHGSTENSKRTSYRSCAGPGFKNIQRLKEHLKRTHYPVQCNRCWQIFPGSDRAVSVLALESRRQLPDSCKLREPKLKEGISDAQWAKLDKKKSVKKDQASHRVEKYWEIWDILFPGVSRPSNPLTGDDVRFAFTFDFMLKQKVKDHHIRFPHGLDDEMSEKVTSLAQQAFSIFTGLHATGLSSNSSSSRSLQHTSLGSSFELVNPRSLEGRHSSSASSSSAARSQAFSADMQASQTPNSMIIDSRDRRNSMPPPPPYLNMQQQMAPHNYTMSVGMHNQHSSHQPFPVNMSTDIAAFGTGQFQHNALTQNSGEWYGVEFDGPVSTFSGSHSAAGFVSLSGGQISQAMIAPDDAQAMSRWPRIPGSRRPQFEGQPQ